MDEKSAVRRRLERDLGERLPSYVWHNKTVQEIVESYLSADEDAAREDEWGALVEVAQDRMQLVKQARAEALGRVEAGPLGGAQAVSRAATRRQGRTEGELETAWFVGPTTTAMLQAMSEFFAGLAHQHPEVKKFREEVLGAKLLTPDEAHGLIASYAARTLSLSWFREWHIPVVGHQVEILNSGPRGEQYNPVDDWMTIRVDPPGVTKTVRYAYPRKDDPNTRCIVQGETVIPIYSHLPLEPHGNHTYPSWLWPGSVVDYLYELSVELADTFAWPRLALDTLGRPRNEAAVWFLLTGERPEVRPIEARWEQKGGGYFFSPQWRIQFTTSPWLSEKELLRAYRLMRGKLPRGTRLPKTTTPLEVAHFVWEQERQNGYKRPSWPDLLKQWNDKHPGKRFEDYRDLRKYCMRGAKAVIDLNFNWPSAIRLES